MADMTLSDWQARAAILNIEGRAFIDGQYTPTASGETFACVSPIDGRKLADIALAGADDVERAVAVARKAFDSGVWSQMAPRARKDTLKRFADQVRAHADELALLESLDMGKPVADAASVDVSGAAYAIEWYGEAIDKIGGEVAPVDPKLLGLVTREAIGVVAAVVPWNFPIMMASWKIAPALAAGNSVILKPSEKSPLTAIRLAALARDAGIPDGVFQVLPGTGDTGRLLALHMDIDCLAFTGSTGVGKLIAGYAAQSNLKRVWLELGGKSANIVLDDCPNLLRAARSAAGGIFFNQGQVCSAGSRVLVHNRIKDRFVEALAEAARGWQPGNPLDPDTTMGAIVDRIQFDKVRGYIDAGRRESTLLFGGNAAEPVKNGLYIEPTAFLTEPGSVIEREEIFGPVLSIVGFDDVNDAVRLANDSIYGLAGAVWTSNLSTAHTVSRALRAGTVWVNCYDEGGDMNMPFGGFKQSGNGRDKSLHALEKYTELKSTVIKL